MILVFQWLDFEDEIERQWDRIAPRENFHKIEWSFQTLNFVCTLSCTVCFFVEPIHVYATEDGPDYIGCWHWWVFPFPTHMPRRGTDQINKLR